MFTPLKTTAKYAASNFLPSSFSTSQKSLISNMTQGDRLAFASALASGDPNAIRVAKNHMVVNTANPELHAFLSDPVVQKDLFVGLMTGQLIDSDVISCISRVTVSLPCQESMVIWQDNFKNMLSVLPEKSNAINALYLLNGDIPLEDQNDLAQALFNMPFQYDVATKGVLDNLKKFTNPDSASLITWKQKKVSEMNPHEKKAFRLALASDNVNVMTVIGYHMKGNNTDSALYDFFADNTVQQELLRGLMIGKLTSPGVIPFIYRVPVALSCEEGLRIWDANFSTLLEVLPKQPSAINALYLLNTEIPFEHQYVLAQTLFGKPFQHEKLDDIVESGLAFNLSKFTDNDAISLLACGLMECASMTYSRQLMHFFLPVWNAEDNEIEAKHPLSFTKKMEGLGPKNSQLDCSRLNGFRLLLTAFFVKSDEFDLTKSHLKILKLALKSDFLANKADHTKELEKVKRLSQDRTVDLDAERVASHELLAHLSQRQQGLVSPLPKSVQEFDSARIDSQINCTRTLFPGNDDAEQTSPSNNSAMVLVGVAALVAAVGVIGYQLWSQVHNPDVPPDL